jgi:hypothetical protein
LTGAVENGAARGAHFDDFFLLLLREGAVFIVLNDLQLEQANDD